MPTGKYFFIKSKLNGLVLEVEGATPIPGSKVITCEKKDSDNDKQLWYEFCIDGTIHNKLSDLCLEIDENNTLIVNTPDITGKNKEQQWMTANDRIFNRSDSNRVIDIADEDTSPGARVCACEFHGGNNQLWNFEHRDARYFYIVSCMNLKVLDVNKANPDPGARVITYPKHPEQSDNQLWYEDEHGIIRSKLTNDVMDSSKDVIRMDHFQPGSLMQMWVRRGNKIVNSTNPTSVLTIKKAKDKDGAKIIPTPYNGKDHQHWEYKYIN